MTSPQGVGGEYPASSTSASEAANEKTVKNRGPSQSKLGFVLREELS